MSTIYDRIKPQKEPSGVQDGFQLQPKVEEVTPEVAVPAFKDKEEAHLDLEAKLGRATNALSLVDDVVLKQYLTKLSDMSVQPIGEPWNVQEALKDVRLFKVDKMVYEKDEYATEKFNSIISAMTYNPGTVFMIVDGFVDHTSFYLGVKLTENPDKSASEYDKTLQRALHGQFPGVKVSDMSITQVNQELSPQELLVNRMRQDASSISVCTCVPGTKNSKGEYTNATFIQGIEKFASAMAGKRYTAIIIANNVSDSEIARLRMGYEDIYTQLSATSTQQFAYSTNESLANALSRSKGVSKSQGRTETFGESESEQHSHAHTKQESHTHTEGESKENFWGKAAKFADPLMEAGAFLTISGFGAPLGAVMMGAGAIAGIGGMAKAKQKNKSDAHTEGTSDTDTESFGKSKNHSVANSENNTESFTETDGTTSTIGRTKNFTVTIHDKHVQEILKRIDKQLERMAESESTGMWATSAYFMSYDSKGSERAVAESCAAIYRSIVQGEQSGIEQSAISTWYRQGGSRNFENILDSVCSLSHPVFSYSKPGVAIPMQLPPTNMLSSKEVAMMIALPRKSVPGFPVVEHISLGKEVVRLGDQNNSGVFQLGCIFDQGIERPNNKVSLDTNSLARHTFVTGSTGSGKSETLYKLIDSIRKADAKTLIIEPAKGEYKKVFGTDRIYGTNPLISNLLKINPFKFPEGVHVLEHADRLIEIFNVCWPMYAAMPAVLKEAVLNAYEDCGWDLVKSKNKYSERIFPTFADLIWELETVIELSAYSEEVKSNYKGSLVTRVKSLANGINGEIFSGEEIGDHILFDENVIVDISRIGSQETKALIMGILIMRLKEYRENSGLEANSDLRHVTILEEAHNLLKRCSQEQSAEGSNLTGKSVEMITNAIAEMRTYGEGFIIVDQSPGAVDISAIRNTNTKIIMRLPEDTDRKAVGKSAAMKDNQVDEIAKLPTGVAVVYQNDWEEPVLCKIEQFPKEKRLEYEFKEEVPSEIDTNELIVETLKFMLQTKVAGQLKYDLDVIKTNISKSTLPTYVKIHVLEALREFKSGEKVSIWENNEFVKFSWVISGLLGTKQSVLKITQHAPGYDELTAKLKALIHERIKNLPEQLDMAIIQSLLRDYSTGNDARLRRYSEWLKTARERMK